MRWGTPSFPSTPRGAPTVTHLEHAHLTAVRQGPLHGAGRPDRWFTGAVHDRDGRLVGSSLRLADLGGHRWIAADPLRVEVPRRRRRSGLRGRWLYGGTWCAHFGHFLTESLTTLWPDPAEVGPVAGLVFHRGPRRDPRPRGWQRELLALAGWGGLPVEIVTDDARHVEQLVVPSRPVVLNGYAHPQARDLWLRVTTAAGGSPGARRVLLSRTAWHAAARASGVDARESGERDHEIDRVFAARGFEIVAPEQLDVTGQVQLLAGADVVAGPAGSALHLAAFAPAATRVLEVGDARSPDRPLAMQRVVDTACGHPTAFAPRQWDAGRLGAELDELLPSEDALVQDGRR